MTVKINKLLKHKKSIIILSLILAIVFSLLVFAIVFVKVGEAKLRKQLTLDDTGLSTDNAYGDSAEVFHNGQGYVYNENLINILCIGVDKQNASDRRDRQADALYLVSLDTKSNKFNVLAISRNTLVYIDVYDINNEFLATEKAQICLSYVYGKNDKRSTLLTCKAVSRLLYDVPINAYYTIFMDSIKDIVDSVNGVEIVIPEDMSQINENWSKGRKVKLDGSNALRFLQYRGETHAPRLERQKLFINNFIASAKKAFKNDVLVPVDLFKKISKNSVTDIDAAQVSFLAKEMVNASFKMNSIPGTEGFDGMYETFQVDDELLYQTVLNLFYIKTN